MEEQKQSIENDGKTTTTVEAASDTMSPVSEFDKKEVKRVLQKIDYHLIPILSVLYLLSYLDRTNMGNAAISGLRSDLNLTPAQYNLCLTVFFIPYSIFEVPSNIVLKFVRPSIWIPVLIVAWGTVTTLMGIVQNYTGLLIARIFLGVAEAGFFPAATYILTNWYCRRQITRPFSGADKTVRLFILEGILTVVVGLATPFLLPDSPRTAGFLSPEERELIEDRLRGDAGPGAGDLDEGFKSAHIWAAFKDWKVYPMIVVFWGSAITVFGFIYTVPTVIRELGYTASIAQLMTIPIYVVAMISVLAAAKASDRMKQRSPFIIYPLMVAAVGFIALMAIPKGRYPGAIYAMLFPVAIGIYTIFCGTIAWSANNIAGPWKRAVGMAFVISVGNLGGAIGTNIYLTREAPHYWTGYGVSLAIVIAAMAAAWFLRVRLIQINNQRDKMTDEEVRARYTNAQLRDMGDESPFFRYTI